MIIKLNELEEKRYHKFYKKHKRCHINTGAISTSNVEIIITGSSMGDFIKVKCSTCRKEKDITDYNKI